MKQHPFAASIVLSFALLAGCAEQQPAEAPVSIGTAEISRDVAVSTARQDAAARFALHTPASVFVSRSGRYWVVDLRTADGGALHYAIAGDGTIRERRMMQ
jgi:hypothetical protein